MFHKIIDEINSCQVIISSSLHGIITCHAYNIPCLWYKFSEKIVGDGIKFADYFSSVNIKPYNPFKLHLNTKAIDIIKIIKFV